MSKIRMPKIRRPGGSKAPLTRAQRKSQSGPPPGRISGAIERAVDFIAVMASSRLLGGARRRRP